jgi:bacteriocin-like protein
MTNTTDIATCELTFDELNTVSGGNGWGTLANLMTARNVAIGATVGCPGLAFEAGVAGASFVMAAGVIRLTQ